MEFSIFFKGIILGISLAIPVGPIGLLCINRTLRGGFQTGFVSGLGVATADTLYGIIAVFGLTIVSGLILSENIILQIAGGIFLCYLGVKIIVTEPTCEITEPDRKSLLKAFASMFILTITNPTTILAFAAIFAALGIAESGTNFTSSTILVSGIFLGSSLWWFTLSMGIEKFRDRLSEDILKLLNRVSGGIILLLGLLSVIYNVL